MRRILGTWIWLAYAGGVLQAGEAPAPAPQAVPFAAEHPADRIERALRTRVDSLDSGEHTLTEWLQLFGTAVGEKFVLDGSLPASVGDTRIKVSVQAGGTLQDALGVALSLTGLRYAVLNDALFISTEGKLAEKLLTSGGLLETQGSLTPRDPMTVGEAVTRSQPFDPYQDEFIGARDFIGSSPWRHWEAPTHNARTGLTDFPGPPVWMEDPDVGHPRFRYTGTPYFLKPEYQAYEMEKQELREEEARRERAEHAEQARQSSRASEDDAQALAALLKFLKSHPEMKAEEILQKLGAEK